MSSTDEVLAKARETLDRTSAHYVTGPGRRARENDIAKRITRVAIADLAIVGVAVAIGLVIPIGVMGFFLMLVAMVVASVVLLDAPAAADIRMLVGEQRPEFVKGYEAVPKGLRGVERNGKTPDQQLVDGLGLIGREIDEMAAQLAQGDLDALSTRGRYLEIKYQGDQAPV